MCVASSSMRRYRVDQPVSATCWVQPWAVMPSTTRRLSAIVKESEYSEVLECKNVVCGDSYDELLLCRPESLSKSDSSE